MRNMPSLEALLAQAADPDHTPNEQAAALSVAAREHTPDPTWPDPPTGWQWHDGCVIRSDLLHLYEPSQPTPAEAEQAAEPEQATRPQRAPKPGSNVAIVLDLLRRPEGVSIEEMVAELGCKPHSAKAMISIYVKRVGATAECAKGRFMRNGSPDPRH